MKRIRHYVRLASAFAAALTVAPFAQGQELTRRSFLTDRGQFEITGEPARPKIVGIGMSENSAGSPVYVAPHFYWGVSDDVSLGITHDTGLCLEGCDDLYSDVGFGMLVFLSDGPRHEIDLHVGAPVKSFDPFFLGVFAGVLGRVNLGSVTALVFDPRLYFGLAGRDEGNGDGLSLPVWFYFQATRVVVPFVGTAVHGPLRGFGDAFQIPVEGGVVFSVSSNVDLGFVLQFGNLLGRGGSVDWRELGFIGRFAF